MEPLKQKLDGLLRKEQVHLALECAVTITGIRGGLNPIQQSDFWSPMGKFPESEEERFFQDLVFIHRVLPLNDRFSPALAGRGYYTKLKHQVLDEFWENYDPEHKQEVKSHRPIKVFNPKTKGLRPSRPTRRKNNVRR